MAKVKGKGGRGGGENRIEIGDDGTQMDQAGVRNKSGQAWGRTINEVILSGGDDRPHH